MLSRKTDIAAQAAAGGSAESVWSICKALGLLLALSLTLAALPWGCQSKSPTPSNSGEGGIYSEPQRSETAFVVPVGKVFRHSHADAHLIVTGPVSGDVCGIGIQIDGSQQVRAELTIDELHGLLTEPGVWVDETEQAVIDKLADQ